MVVSKRVAWFLVAFGVWSWVIWPTFLKNIWADPRSWNHGMTAFFAVHLVLTIVSLTLGTIIGVYGVRALLKLRFSGQSTGRERLRSQSCADMPAIHGVSAQDRASDGTRGGRVDR